MWPPPYEELKRLMGMDDAQWRDAGEMQDLLQMIHQQRNDDMFAARGAYPYIAHTMYRCVFGKGQGPSYDEKRKCLWYLGYRGPTRPEDPTLEVRTTFHTRQKNHYIYVIVDKKGIPSRKLLKFDMLKPQHRQAFLDVRHGAERNVPPEMMNTTAPKHKNLLRVMHSPRSKKRSAEKAILENRTPKGPSRLHEVQD
ncbi:hypothetical protein B0J14DRAFT_309024 [Halenospora varia]|nr:hypothetical protein B0J14DRAFT_309024 [Halenospora varia]